MPLSEPTTGGADSGRFAIMEGFINLRIGGSGLFGSNILWDPYNLITIGNSTIGNGQSVRFNNAGRYKASFKAQFTQWTAAGVIVPPADWSTVNLSAVVQLFSGQDLATPGEFVNNTVDEINNVYGLIYAGNDGVTTWARYDNIGFLGDTIIDVLPGYCSAFVSVGLIPDWWAPNQMNTRIFQKVTELSTP